MFLYYLLYKLKISPIYWIVKVENDKNLLLEHIENFKSKYENYYIIERKIEICNEQDIEDECSIKQFNIFKLNTKDKIIDQTI